MGDERCFPNPHLHDPECNEVEVGSVETPPALQSALRQSIESNLPAVHGEYLPHPQDLTVYTGSAGVAFLHLHLATTLYRESRSDRLHHLQSALTLLGPALSQPSSRRHTYLCGSAGPLALAAVVHGYLGNTTETKACVERVKEVYTVNKSAFSSMPSELLVGHAGYLYVLLYLNAHIPGAIEEALITEVTSLLLDTGERGREGDKATPLMYTWHGKHYLGAAHGLAGILNLLLQVPVPGLRTRITSLVRPCLDYLLSLQLPSGNFPSSLESLSSDRLVHWCHGAPGLVHLLARAYKEFGDERYLHAAQRCGEVVWQRGLLRKGCGLCHGVAGNGYTFLRLHQLTGQTKYLHRTFKFAEWCLTSAERKTRTPDRPFSLFEGLAGTMYFYTDVLHGLQNVVFPALDLPAVTNVLSM